MPCNAIPSRSNVPTFSRLTAIALCVAFLHAGLLYTLYSGMLPRTVELVVPIVMLAQAVEQPPPKLAKPEPSSEPAFPSPPIKKPAAKTPIQAAPAPAVAAINNPAPLAAAPPAEPAPQLTPAVISGSTETGMSAQATSPSPTSSQLPSSNADYLQNPKPAYPAISRRLNEQGRTTVRVLIGADGLPQRAEIARSSGFARLDDAAVATVMRWRYVPGRRGGTAEAMWFNVPINWVLE